MNYYQDSRNDYSRDCDKDSRINYSQDYNNNTFDSKNEYYHNGKRACCVRKVEETFCCYPSYYNEEKKEDKKEDKKEYNHCWEGTFQLCPKYEEKKDCKDKDYDKKDDCRDEKDNHNYGCRCQNRCGFCGLFRRW